MVCVLQHTLFEEFLLSFEIKDIFKSKKAEVNDVVYFIAWLMKNCRTLKSTLLTHSTLRKPMKKICADPEGRNEDIIKVGDHAKCPECNRMGRVVWVSKDGATAGFQCLANHRQTSRPASNWHSYTFRSKNSRNMFFITEVE